MNTRRTFAVSRRVLRGLKHDRRSIGLILFAPIMAMFVFNIAFAGDVTDVPVALVEHDSPYTLPNNTTVELGPSIVKRLDTHLMRLIPVDDEAAAVAMVERGEARAAIIIPANFTRDAIQSFVNASVRTAVVLRLDRSNVNVAADIERSLADALRGSIDDVGRPPGISLDDTEPVYGKGAKFADFFIPGIMTFAVFLLTNLLTITGFVQERITGVLDRLAASPLTDGELVVGTSLAYSLVAIVQAAILITVAVVVFGVTIVGSVGLAFVIVALLAVASQALGILLSSAARNEAQAVQTLPFLIFPVFLLSGIFWPIEAIPSFLRPLSWGIPPTYSVEALRDVMVRGWGIDKVGAYILALALFGVLFLTLARFSLKRSRK